MSRTSALVLALLITLSSGAQEYERVLLPVGQLGNLGYWVTSIRFYNGGSSAVPYFPYYRLCPRPPYQCSPPPQIQPRQIVVPALMNVPPGQPTPGVFLYFPAEAIDAVAIDARVSHASRIDPSYGGIFVGGAQLPAVRSDEFESDRIVLMGITLLPPFSQTLRIYEDGNGGNRSFRLRFFTSTETIGERIVTTQAPDSSGGPPYGPYFPAGLQIAELLVAFPELSLGLPFGANVEITPLQPETRFWAFISLTNRLTNEVSLVLPE